MKDLKAAQLLGWASLAIAATEIFAQGIVEREMIGIDEHPYLMRGLGIREAIAGITILSQHKITPTLVAGIWSRVAGDAMDLALLGIAFPKTTKPKAFAITNLLVAPIIVADVFYAFRLTRRLLMAKVDVRHAAALDDSRSPAGQPAPRGLPEVA